MFTALPDLSFYMVAIPAVMLVGLSKGGMGEAFSLMGVPLLSFSVAPVQAAAIMLPILIVMDLVSLYIWRRYNDAATLKILLPGALAGIALGWATSAMVPPVAMKLVIGTVTVLFALRYVFQRLTGFDAASLPARTHNRLVASGWSLLSGYGSFVAHSGGPPIQIYALPLKLDPRAYTGMVVRFFAIINAIKLVPYYLLGQFDLGNIATSVTLFPFAPLATVIGALVVKRLKPAVFYPVMYGMALISGTKLLYDGVMSLL